TYTAIVSVKFPPPPPGSLDLRTGNPNAYAYNLGPVGGQYVEGAGGAGNPVRALPALGACASITPLTDPALTFGQQQGVFQRVGTGDFVLFRKYVCQLSPAAYTLSGNVFASLGSSGGGSGAGIRSPGIEAASDTTSASDSTQITVTRTSTTVTLGIFS